MPSPLSAARAAIVSGVRAVEVGSHCQVPGGGKPVGVLPDVVGESEDLVQHDDSRPRPLADGRHSQVRLQVGSAGPPGMVAVGMAAA
jgi:hypothetical protein